MDYVTLPYHFARWYVTQLPFKILRFFLNTNLYIEDILAIRLHTRLFFVPLFHDTTIIGRISSVIFRMTRIFGGVWVLLCANMLLAIAVLLWFFLPVAPFINKFAFAVWPILFFVYAKYIFLHPTKRLTTKTSVNEVNAVLTKQVQSLLPLLQRKPYKFYEKLVHSKQGEQFFARMHIDRSNFLLALYKQQLPMLTNRQALLSSAQKAALICGGLYIDSEHILLALLMPPSPHAPLLQAVGLEHNLVAKTAQINAELLRLTRRPLLWDDDFFIHSLGGVNRGWLGVPTPTLNLYSTDITELAQKGRLPHVVGRETIVDEIVQVLAKSERENVLLLGESGSGKTSIVHKIAQRIIEGGVPNSLFSKRLVRLDSANIAAGITIQGGLEERMNTIMKEVKRTGNVILFLDDVHTFLAISSQAGNLDMFSFLKPHISSNELQIIAATSTENYARFVEPNQDFVRLFQKIDVPVATNDEAIHMLTTEALTLERKHHVVITTPALIAAVMLSDRYIHNRVLPGKAIDLLDEACVMALNKQPLGQSQAITVTVLPEYIEQLVEQKTHTKVHNATREEKLVLLNLEEKIHQRLVGQEQAVRAVANALRRARSGLHETERPIASFLFVGPTGVGKTELAKALASIYFGSDETMVRFDMSEYQDALSIYRLIGSPPSSGQVEPGRLTEAVRERPSALILLDELEKGSVDIANLLLQILEDGRLTDSLGRSVTFKDAIIIATSNAATQEIEQQLQAGVTSEQIQTDLLGLLTKYFRIELLNRFDGIILFKPLTNDAMVRITQLLLTELSQTLLQKGYQVGFAPDLIASLAQRGYNPLLGARPLRRLIQDEVESQLAKLILSEKLKKGQPIVLGTQYFPPQPFAT